MGQKRLVFFIVIPVFLGLIANITVSAQQFIISGIVEDSITHEPLAFVNILHDESGRGSVTSIDGKFKISLHEKPEKLVFSYVGYQLKTIYLTTNDFTGSLNVKLSPKTYNLKEVMVFPGENPAHRIIQLASDNRKLNHPEKIGSFSYISYDKMIFTTDMDTLSEPRKKKQKEVTKNTEDFMPEDSSDAEARAFLEKQYLLMMESISSRKFIYPDKNKEDIIASRVSGLKQPSFVIMASQFQSFSFYDDFITLSDKKYLNPISQGSTSKYFFLLEDTLINERNDTVFIISFKPRKGKNFDGLKGVLYINSYKWAVQNVIAEASGQQNEMISIKIQQKYELVDGTHWFPVQLNTNLIFNNVAAETNTRSMKIIGIGKSYLINIRLNPELDKKEFSSDYVSVNENAHQMPEELWNKYRTDSLSQKEKETYRVIDSVGKAEHFDTRFNTMESFMTGYLPGNFFNIDLKSLINYNSYEGWRLGLGGVTSKNLSGIFSLGGHFAYGFDDKHWKYGIFSSVNLSRRKEISFKISYLNDIEESGGVRFLEQLSFLSSESYREYMIESMDKVEKRKIEFTMRMFKYLKANFFLSNSSVTSGNSYMFSLSDQNPSVLINNYHFTEAGVRLRYAFGEGFMVTPRGNKFSMGTKYPVFYLNISHGFRGLNGDFDFTRTETKISKVITTRRFGDSKIQFVAGYVDGAVPYSRLYAGNGSYKKFGIESEYSFSTMRFNEFLSDRFISFFFKQDFGKLIFHAGKFTPNIVLANNIGFGWLSDKNAHKNIEFNTLEKGYYECGLLINNILKQKFFGYGIGLFYRYGPYSFSSINDNFAFKLTFSLNL